LVELVEAVLELQMMGLQEELKELLFLRYVVQRL
jgi:hypothetical protein